MTEQFSPAFEAGMDARVRGAARHGDGDGLIAEGWRNGWDAADAVLRKAGPADRATDPWTKINGNTYRIAVPGGWIYSLASVSAVVYVPEPEDQPREFQCDACRCASETHR